MTSTGVSVTLPLKGKTVTNNIRSMLKQLLEVMKMKLLQIFNAIDKDNDKNMGL